MSSFARGPKSPPRPPLSGGPGYQQSTGFAAGQAQSRQSPYANSTPYQKNPAGDFAAYPQPGSAPVQPAPASRPTPGYGTPPGRRDFARTADFGDSDGDGVDDRDQDAPGMPNYRRAPRTFAGGGQAQRALPQYQPPAPGQAQSIQSPYDYSTPYGGYGPQRNYARPGSSPAAPTTTHPSAREYTQPDPPTTPTGPPGYKAAYDQAVSKPGKVDYDFLGRIPGYLTSGYMSGQDKQMAEVLERHGLINKDNRDSFSSDRLRELFAFHGGRGSYDSREKATLYNFIPVPGRGKQVRR